MFSYRRIIMFKWLKSLFGTDVPDTPVIAQQPKEEVQSHVSKVVKVEVEQAEAPAKPKKQPKKPAAIKAAKVDLDSMKKDELLAHAKAKGIKANASMNKAALLEAIKNG